MGFNSAFKGLME